MDKPRYTRGQWMIGKVCEDQNGCGVIPIIVEGKPYIGTVRFSNNPAMCLDVAEENALRIVQCVNSHDELLEACKEALKTHDDNRITSNAIIKLTTVIAKATEE